jgi:hypothetical protein
MKALKIVAGVIVVLIVGVIVVLMTVDVSQYKGMIQDQAKAATGREVTIGDIKLSLSLSPAIVVTDVKVANASWGSRREMLTLKQLEAQTELIPLLFGTVNISGLKLVDPDAVLETNASGKGNWEFETASSTASGDNASQSGNMPLNVSGVSVEGLKLVYRDGKTKSLANIAAKTADIDIDGPLMALRIPSMDVTEAVGSFKDGAKAGSGSVGKFSLKAVGPITDINLTKLTVDDAKGEYKDGAESYQGAVKSLSMEGEGAARPPAKNMDVVAAVKALTLTKFSLDTATVAVKQAKATANAEVGKITVDAKGKLGDFGITNLAMSDSKLNYKGAGAPVDVTLDKLSLDGVGVLTLAAKVNGQDLKASGTLAPVAALAAMDKSFPAKVILEGFGLKADTDITIDVSGKRPMAKGSLKIPELDLAAYTKDMRGSGGGGGSAGAARSGGKVFSDDPLAWDALTAADADVHVTVGKMTLPNGIELKDFTAPTKLTDGKLVVKPATFGVAGGAITTDVDANAGDKSFGLKVTAKGISAETLSKELKHNDIITQGPIDLNIDVRGSGNSMHALMASLNGSVIAGMGESRIRSDALNIIGADVIMQVLNALNPMGNKDPYTVARCAVVNLQIAGGVANTNEGIALVTDKMQVTSSGKIDLGGERIDLNVRPKATSGLGVGLGSLVQAVKVTGPLSSPGIGIDKNAAIKSLGTLGAAFATGGASFLAQAAKDKVDNSRGDPCQLARTWHTKK